MSKASADFNDNNFVEAAFKGLKSPMFAISGYGGRTTPKYVRDFELLTESTHVTARVFGRAGPDASGRRRRAIAAT